MKKNETEAFDSSKVDWELHVFSHGSTSVFLSQT